ncbi:hypothetical protein BVRB_020430 [Beta vulgaris subsp. vulgaris]|uniref:Uncharacterized protein n=1 Tax=Beta vulgaris subsp. vulgaris TaxID=3555 RepID=A0A0J8B0N6_BETVV|nr:hypothetical protein BVRB_020430 [Beta vulgaris subsp. vulgaris]
MILFEWVPALLKNPQDNIKLVVVDSVAALLRMEGSVKDRSQLAYHLRQLAMLHNICIVASNQVSDVMSNQASGGQLQFLSSGRLVTPALGRRWSIDISRRIILTRDRSPVPRRVMFASGSSYCPDGHIEFYINDMGVFGKPQSDSRDPIP